MQRQSVGRRTVRGENGNRLGVDERTLLLANPVFDGGAQNRVREPPLRTRRQDGRRT